MAYGDRKQQRVRFENEMQAVIMAVDGTWRRDCAIADVSHSGAKLTLTTPMAGLNLQEFFLLLTPSGSAFRRCVLVRVDGETIGVRFIAADKASRRSGRRRLEPAGG